MPSDMRWSLSDGYHTFNELYEHRIWLYRVLVNTWLFPCHKSKLHNDWTSRDWWFICMMYIDGKQISYHIPMWHYNWFLCEEREYADRRDGHKSKDVEKILFEYYPKEWNSHIETTPNDHTDIHKEK